MLEGFDLRGPRVRFKILGGPKNLTAQDLEARRVRF